MEPIWPLGVMIRSAPGVPPGSAPPEKGQLERAARDFEGVFLGILLKTMRGSAATGGLFEEGTDMQMYRDMFDQEIAQGVAKAGGIGLARMIVQDEERRQPGKTPVVVSTRLSRNITESIDK